MIISRALDFAWKEAIFCDVYIAALGIKEKLPKYVERNSEIV